MGGDENRLQTLDEVIRSVKWAADMSGSSKEQELNAQLAGWLEELKENKVELNEVKKELKELKEGIIKSCFGE